MVAAWPLLWSCSGPPLAPLAYAPPPATPATPTSPAVTVGAGRCFFFDARCPNHTCADPIPSGVSGECWFESNYIEENPGCAGRVTGACTGGTVVECGGAADNVSIGFRTQGPGTCTITATVTNRRGDTATASSSFAVAAR